MKAPFTDIRFNVIEKLPEPLRPYGLLARLDRPTGIWLLLIPCYWALFMAMGGILELRPVHIWYGLLFFIGACVMRAAGCIINDLWDRKIDPKVERTKLRPIASGQISIPRAFAFLFLLLFLGLIILLQLPGLSVIIGIFSLLLVIMYPLMKRWTHWPQAFLGLTFNIGVLIGWSSVTGIVETSALLLYFAGFFWTLCYDTIYAYQDIEDDMKVGVKSTALKFKKEGKKYVGIFYGIMFLLLLFAGFSANAFFLYYLCLIPAGFCTKVLLDEWDLDNQESALSGFKKNVKIALFILLACLFV